MLYAVVPVNELGRAKSRLQGLELNLPGLVESWARHVVTTLVDAPSIERVALVSPDASLATTAGEWGADWLHQTQGGLNEGLELGRDWALRAGATGLLIALGDLPLLAVHEVESLTAMRGSVIAPDREQQGTNLLLLRPPRAMSFQFGVNSFSRHTEQAAKQGLCLSVFSSPGSECDVDEPEHLKALCDPSAAGARSGQ